MLKFVKDTSMTLVTKEIRGFFERKMDVRNDGAFRIQRL